MRHRARGRHSAGQPHRPDHGRGTAGAHRRLARRRRLREDGRSRVGLRKAEQPCRNRRWRDHHRARATGRAAGPGAGLAQRRRNSRRTQGRDLRQHRPARWQTRRTGRVGGTLGHAFDRIERRPRAHSRRTRQPRGRIATAPGRVLCGSLAAIKFRRTTRSLRLPRSRPCRRGSMRSSRPARSRGRTWPACSRAGARRGSAAARR